MHVCVVTESSYVSVWGWVLAHVCTGMWMCVHESVWLHAHVCTGVWACVCMHMCVAAESSYVHEGVLAHVYAGM